MKVRTGHCSRSPCVGIPLFAAQLGLDVAPARSHNLASMRRLLGSYLPQIFSFKFHSSVPKAWTAQALSAAMARQRSMQRKERPWYRSMQAMATWSSALRLGRRTRRAITQLRLLDAWLMEYSSKFASG